MNISDTPVTGISRELVVQHLSYSGTQLFVVYLNHGFACVLYTPTGITMETDQMRIPLWLGCGMSPRD